MLEKDRKLKASRKAFDLPEGEAVGGAAEGKPSKRGRKAKVKEVEVVEETQVERAQGMLVDEDLEMDDDE